MNASGWTLFAAPAALLAAVSFAPRFATPQTLVRHAAAPAQQDLTDAAGWRERFENKDLEARERDFEDLVSRAAKSDDARTTLETWSRDDRHVEFAWTCRLALREARARGFRANSSGGFDDPFEQMRQQMFGGQGIGADPFGDFLLLDPFARGGGMSSPFGALSGGATVQSESEGFSLKLGPDGVKVRVKTKDAKGEEHDEEYTAKTLDELLAAHPELSSHVNGGGNGFHFSLPGIGSTMAPRGAPRTDVLGVFVPERSEQNSTGLLIQSVVPGTLAEELGLEAGQFVVSINGRKIEKRDDISSALRERSADAALEVELRSPDGTTSTKSWKPDVNGRGVGRPLQPHAAGGLHKI